MTIYLLVANILLINLLIASFNTIYNSVNARSLQFWNFQRFSVVLEYEEKPVWPAPLTIFSHIYRICKFFYRKCKGQNSRFESGLKLFLSKFDLERLYDFEEECVEGMLKEKGILQFHEILRTLKKNLKILILNSYVAISRNF